MFNLIGDYGQFSKILHLIFIRHGWHSGCPTGCCAVSRVIFPRSKICMAYRQLFYVWLFVYVSLNIFYLPRLDTHSTNCGTFPIKDAYQNIEKKKTFSTYNSKIRLKIARISLILTVVISQLIRARSSSCFKPPTGRILSF